MFVSVAVQFFFTHSLNRLVQTSLFSTTVAIFLMESYKLLSPEFNDVIIASLSQITQRFVSISNVTQFQNVIVQSDAPFKLSASAIRINMAWLLSLVLSLTHALYVVYPLSGFIHGPRHDCHHMLHDIERFRRPRVVDWRPTLLHLSIFLFIAGLIDFLLLTTRLSPSASSATFRHSLSHAWYLRHRRVFISTTHDAIPYLNSLGVYP